MLKMNLPKKLTVLSISILIVMVGLFACAAPPVEDNQVNQEQTEQTEQTEQAAPVSVLISPEDAQEKLKDPSVVLLDVRTLEEYEEAHIPGAILLPDFEINKETAAEFIEDESTEVIVYCRSGRRSAEAANTLADLGYLKVYDLGGIILLLKYS